MKSPIKIALSWFSRKFQEITGELPKAIQEELNNEVSPQKAVNEGFKKQGIFGKLRQRITEVIEKAAEIGFGKKPPKMPELFKAWDSSKMNLSEKLHGADIEMRKSIVNTIREQLKLGNKAQKSALALYDGYNSGKRVIRKQELPIYMQNIVNFARRGDLSDKDKEVLQRLIRNARRQVEHLGENGAPNKALKAAYSELLQAVEDGKAKALERAILTAVEEKSRYVAERIARTEAARAWADAFIARYENDKDVVAYKWQLGSRHPHFDICDMYANANLYGLGAGIFPKDKCPPLPVHPHCLCHLSPIFKSEIDITKQKDRLKEGGAEWLNTLTYSERVKLLGLNGALQFKNGGDFLLSLRGYSGEVMGTRLKNVVTDVVNSGKILNEGGADVMLHSELAIVKDNGIKNDYRVNFELVNSKAYHDKFVGLTEHKALDEALYKEAAKILEHRSGAKYEDIAMLDARTGKFIVGNNTASGEMEFKCGLTPEQAKKLNDSGLSFEILHNHPNSSIPSTDDIKGLFNRPLSVGSTIICHKGTVYRMKKLKQYDNIDQFMSDTYEYIGNVYSGWPENLLELHASEVAIETLIKRGYLTFYTR